MSIFSQAAALLSEAPGSLVYHLVLLFALGAAAAIAVGRWWQQRDAASARLALAATAIFGLRVVSLALVFLAALTLLDQLVVIPPFDRATSTLTLLFIIWLLAFPQPQRLADAALGLLGVLVGLALVISWGLWAQDALAVGFYNNSPQETMWEAAQVGLIVGGIGLLALRRRADWLLGGALLALLMIGHLIHYSQPIAGTNLPGAVRLFEIVAMPMLLAAIYRRAHARRSTPLGAIIAQGVVIPTILPQAQADTPGQPGATVIDVLSTASQKTTAVGATMPDAAAGPAGVVEAPLAQPVPGPAAGPGSALEFAALHSRLSPEEFMNRATRAVGRALPAPLCLLLTPAPGLTELSLQSAFALDRERFLEASLPLLRDAPDSLNALARGEAITWEPGTSERALHNLARAAGLKRAGPLFLAPLRAETGGLLAVLGVVAPASQAQWPADTQSLLVQLAAHLAGAWSAMQTRIDLAAELAKAQAELAHTQQEKTRQREQAQALANQLQLQRRAESVQSEQLQALELLRAQLASAQTDLDQHQLHEQQLGTQIEQAQAELDQRRLREQQLGADLEIVLGELDQRRLQEQQLREELALMQADLAHVSEQASAAAARTADVHETAMLLEAISAGDARQAQQAKEIADLRRALDDSERQRAITTTTTMSSARAQNEQQPSRPVQAADMEVIASVTQELRQPMSSIVGYADLLLSESVGIIGALQRKFLERIKASSERIGVLLDDLMRIMDIDSGNLTLAPESVDVLRVIDDALHSCETLYREKSLHLVREITPSLPAIQADRDALLQIFTHLLNNCGAASASDSEIKLMVNCETDQRPGGERINYLVVSVTDTGGGISPDDQPRVFSRLYRADAPLIAGLGDNGMGLSIAKALVEGHGGRMWVISEPGAGSTFYILLPVDGKPARPNGAHATRG